MRVRGQTWCWIALWATVLALAFAVYVLSVRIERFESVPRDEKVRDHGVPR
jgi:hypothetical protein